MIIDSPVLAGIAQGADRVIPQEGDAQVVIPSLISPVIEPLIPHDVANLTTDRCTTSKFVVFQQSRTNLTSITELVVTLPKGLYRLQYNLAGRFNFTSALLNGVELIIRYQGFDMPFACLFTQVGAQSIEGERLVLLTSDAQMGVVIAATNAVATDSIQAQLGLNVIRIL